MTTKQVCWALLTYQLIRLHIYSNTLQHNKIGWLCVKISHLYLIFSRVMHWSQF